MTRSVLRRLGLGRLAYGLYHAPFGALRASVAAGGPLEQWRTAQGRKAMRAAARDRLPPLPAPISPPVPTVHVLTGVSLWYQTAFMLHSLARFQPVKVTVHSDGSLRGGALAALQRVVPWAEFAREETTEARLEELLPRTRFPALRKRRDELVLFRKLLDVHVGARGWQLFLDSDMLFFRAPAELSAWLHAPARALHMIDVERSYGYDLSLLADLAGAPVPDCVNTGALGLNSESIDWDYLERTCAGLVARAGTHYYQEQALAALQLARVPHDALNRCDYLVRPEPPETDELRAVLHHYVASSKRAYFRRNWQRVLDPA